MSYVCTINFINHTSAKPTIQIIKQQMLYISVYDKNNSYRSQYTQVCCCYSDGLTFGSMEIKLCVPRLESVDLFIVRLWKKW